jgi:hypothetical protein
MLESRSPSPPACSPRMPDPIDDLAQRWKQNPSPAATIALCEALRVAPRSSLLQQVGEFALQRHSADAAVLVSVARMYMEANRFAEAQSALVAAGKQAPRDGDVYRWLGEVLLRRGDADRAEKVLERAIQLGTRDADAQLWLERARVFRPMQAKAGSRAVATEVAHATAQGARRKLDSLSDSTTAVHVRPPPVKPGPSTDSESHRPDEEETTSKHAPPLVPHPQAPRFPRNIDTATNPIELPVVPVPVSSALPSPPPPAPLMAPPPPPPPPVPFAPPPGRPATLRPPMQAALPPPPVHVAPRAPAQASSATQLGEADLIEVSVQAPIPTGPQVPDRIAHPFAAGPPPREGVPPAPTFARRDPAPHRPANPGNSGSPVVPHPRDVLDALELAGVFEPPTGGPVLAAVWAPPNLGPKRKGTVTLIVGMVLFLAGSVGVYFFYRHKRAQEHLAAEALLATVEVQLHEGKPAALADTEKLLGQAFQLETRSPRAAIDWTRERALAGLLKAGSEVAFEDAMNRDKDVGVPEEQYAFARVASFLYQGDTAGAAGAMQRWDTPAGGDAWYQLVAGATFERAGDARARDRYAAAAKVDPDLVVARVAQARVTAVDGDVAEAMRQAKELRVKLPDRVEPVALVALAWGRDPKREDIPAPPEADDVVKRADDLPAGLRFVPHAIAALRALDKKSWDDARTEVQAGLAVAESPGEAVWLGAISLPLGDETIARKAALSALQLSAAYEPARALAARVALLGGRLDEALKATEDLDPSSADVAIVRSAAAYERVDADGLAHALDAIPPDARKLPFLAALTAAPDVLSGRLYLDAGKLMTMSADDAPWSDLVAMDAALDEGDLPTADKIADGWKGSESRPLRALRLARLARYENRLDQAETLSQTALDHGTVTPRVLWERVYVLVARGKSEGVGALLTRYPLVLGPLGAWLGAYATAAGGNADAAKAKVANLDPLPAGTPIEARVVVAAALVAAKDKKRGEAYVQELLGAGSLHPDLVAAALALGFHRVDRRGRRPTYE